MEQTTGRKTFASPELLRALFSALEKNRAGVPPPGELQQYCSQISSSTDSELNLGWTSSYKGGNSVQIMFEKLHR